MPSGGSICPSREDSSIPETLPIGQGDPISVGVLLRYGGILKWHDLFARRSWRKRIVPRPVFHECPVCRKNHPLFSSQAARLWPTVPIDSVLRSADGGRAQDAPSLSGGRSYPWCGLPASPTHRASPQWFGSQRIGNILGRAREICQKIRKERLETAPPIKAVESSGRRTRSCFTSNRMVERDVNAECLRMALVQWIMTHEFGNPWQPAVPAASTEALAARSP